MDFSDPNALIEPEELAARWKMKPITLAHWRWTGRGPRFLKMGRNPVYRLKDIAAFEEEKAQRSTTRPKTRAEEIEDMVRHSKPRRRKMKLKKRL